MANNLTPKEEFLLNPVTEHNITDAAIATFETNLRHGVKVEVPLEPKQDLHGYDYPWPAGGGKNLVNPNGLTNERCNSAGNMYSSNTSVSTTFLPVVPGETYTASFNQTLYSIQFVQFDAEKTWIKNNNASNRNSYTVQLESTTVYVRIVAILDNTSAMQVETFISTYHPQLELGSTATAYAPYENICPIEGYTECEVDGANANLLPISMSWIKANNTSGVWSGNNYVINGLTFSCNAVGDLLNSVSIFGTKSSNNNSLLVLCNTTLKANTAYVLTGCPNGGSTSTFRIYGYGGTPVQYFIDYGTGIKKTFSTDVDFTFDIRCPHVTTAYTYTGETFYPMLRLATSEDTGQTYTSIYATPNTTTLPISWKHAEGTYEFSPVQEGSGDPSPENVRPIYPALTITRDDNTELTVYGGSITFNDDGTSRVVEDRTIITVSNVDDNSYTSYNGSVSTAREFNLIYPCMHYTDTYVLTNSISNYLLDMRSSFWNQETMANKYGIPLDSSRKEQHDKLGIRLANELIGVDGTETSTERTAKFNTYLAEHPAQIVYMLANPITHVLSITETQHVIEALGDKVTTTIYSGTVTVNEDGSADVVSDYALGVFNGTESWAVYGATGFSIDLRSTMQPSQFADGLSNMFPVVASGIPTMANIRLGANNFLIYVRSIIGNVSGVTDLETWKAFLATNNLQVTYPLITPHTYHFPNVGQLKAFLGTNNIWSDIGNVNVKYLTQNSETGMEYRGDRALELRRRAMIADAPTIHTTTGSSDTGGLASFKSYIKAPVKKIEIPFGPKQDLHGYDYPWPAGGGKNLIDFVAEYSNVSGVTINGDSSSEFSVSGLASAVRSKRVSIPDNLIGKELTLSATMSSGKNGGVFFTIIKNGSMAYRTPVVTKNDTQRVSVTFEAEENTKIVLDYTAGDYTCIVSNLQIELGSTATAYEPYENICPINGWDKCIIKRGKLNWIQMPVGTASGGGITVISDGSKLVISGTVTTSYAWIKVSGDQILITTRVSSMINSSDGSSVLKEDVTWQPTLFGPEKVYVIYYVYSDHTYMGRGYNSSEYYAKITPTQPVNTIWIRFNKNEVFDNDEVRFMIAPGTERSDAWIAPDVETIPIAFTDPSTGDPLTIYGGTVTLNEDGSADVVSEFANVTVTEIIAEVVTNPYAPYNAENSTAREFSIALPFKRVSNAVNAGWIAPGSCSNYLKYTNTTFWNNINRINEYGVPYGMVDEDKPHNRLGIRLSNTLVGINAEDNTQTRTEKFNAFLSTHPVQICYPLKAPQTYHFSNLEELKVWLGENNFWCDISDDISVKYWNRGFGN